MYTEDWENFKKYTIDNACPLSSASGGFGQENRRTKDTVYICPGHVSRSGARPHIREAIMPRSRHLLSNGSMVSVTGGLWNSPERLKEAF